MTPLEITYKGQLWSHYEQFGAAHLLEFCIISGLDTMVVLKPQMIDMIVDKFTDNFNRQPKHVTQFYYRWIIPPLNV